MSTVCSSSSTTSHRSCWRTAVNKRTLSKLAKAGEPWAQPLPPLHHEAYLVGALGYEHSGVPPAEFLQMVDAGILQPITEPRPANTFEAASQAGGGWGKGRPAEA